MNGRALQPNGGRGMSKFAEFNVIWTFDTLRVLCRVSNPFSLEIGTFFRPRDQAQVSPAGLKVAVGRVGWTATVMVECERRLQKRVSELTARAQ